MGKRGAESLVSDEFLRVYRTKRLRTYYEKRCENAESGEQIVWTRKRSVCSRSIISM